MTLQCSGERSPTSTVRSRAGVHELPRNAGGYVTIDLVLDAGAISQLANRAESSRLDWRPQSRRLLPSRLDRRWQCRGQVRPFHTVQYQRLQRHPAILLTT